MNKELQELLLSKEEYVVEGTLNKNLVGQLARNYDAGLLNILQSNEKIKHHFFASTEGGLIFKLEVFLQFLNNKAFLPDSYTIYKQKIGLAYKGEVDLLSQNKEIVLNWPYKDCILEGGQHKEDTKRKEIFFNSVLAPSEVNRYIEPKALTNFEKYSTSGVERPTTIGSEENLVIKGNNLVGLYSVKQYLKKHDKKIKLVYLDPPYNTGNDSFRYNDSFNHSTWLTFMKNRIAVARDLMDDDGIIWVQTDDVEVNYLGVLMDEIFGRENFINLVTVKTKIGGVSGSAEGKSLKDTTEFIQLYAKNKSQITLEPVFAMTPVWDYIQTEYIEAGKSWKYTSVLTDLGDRVLLKDDAAGGRKYYHYPNAKSVSVKQYARANNITEEEVYNSVPDKIFQTTNAQTSIRTTVMEETAGIDNGVVSIEYVPTKGKNKDKVTEILYTSTKRMFMFLSDMLTKDKDGNLLYKEKLTTLWDAIQYNNLAKEGKVDFPNGKKPEKLLQNVIEMSSYKDDYVLDFFGGSGTTAATAHKLGRKYITIEQLDTQIDIIKRRLQNVIDGEDKGISSEIEWSGGGSFVYCEIKNDAADFVERIDAARDESQLLELFELAKKSSFISYRVDPKKMKSSEFEKLSFAEQKQLLREIIDNNNLYVNYSDIEDQSYGISAEDKVLNRQFYGGGE
ncbi:DNA methyltransferase [Staphylococcus equorum]|uniref:DNA methyltransferase n=1 Tax=Staphylococcus equorum TaxID=246432 RepID=UPI0021BEB7C0|nr:site-specific DNA-methyltransferase [Staphylococcus equorum]